MIFWSFLGTMTYTKVNFCFHESIFQWQIKLISRRSQFWHLRRKTAVIFSKLQFFQNSLVISWATSSGNMQMKKWNNFWMFNPGANTISKSSFYLSVGWKNTWLINRKELSWKLGLIWKFWLEVGIYWKILVWNTFEISGNADVV